jgi:hypothetical protein
MRPNRRPWVALVVVAAALAAPADAVAGDHVWLSLKTAKVGSAWTLTGASISGDFYPNDKEILGVTLSHRRSAVAVERHALRAGLARATVTFDGQRGRWQARGVNDVLDVKMAIARSGTPVSVTEEVLGCRGSFVRVPVTLTGTFALRTGTKALQTVRRTRLAALLTYNKDGEVACGPTTSGCEDGASLTASSGLKRLSVDLARRSLALSFPTSRGWYHVLERTQLDVSGELPTIRVAAAGLGSVTFSATKTVEGGSERCRIVTAEGTLSGTLTARFAAWGTRTFRATSAQYRRVELP